MRGAMTPADVRDAILPLLPARTNALAVRLRLSSARVSVACRWLAGHGLIVRLRDWRWAKAGDPVVASVGQAAGMLGRPRAVPLTFATCHICRQTFEVGHNVTGMYCSKRCASAARRGCSRPSGARRQFVATRPVEQLPRPRLEAVATCGRTVVVDGIAYEVVFDGRGESPDWPVPSASPLVGTCRVVGP